MLLNTFNYIIERSDEFTRALSQHLGLTFIALGIALAVGLVFGVLSTRIRWLGNMALFVGNIGRTLPSVAVLALALPLLGIGRPPTILALVFIGTLPILINTKVGIDQVDASIKESARGMGMNDLQVLLQIEFPIASAVIMAGIRTSAVVVVASATLAAFIGGGGLGDLILRGLALNEDHIMLAGAIPATLLAFYFEEAFGRLERLATPVGLKIGTAQEADQGSSLLELLSAVALMPLLFGALLPWVTFLDAEGAKVVLTGLHPEYQLIGLPVLLMGLFVALWPRNGEDTPFSTIVIKGLLSGVGLVWMLVGWREVITGLSVSQSLEYGFYIQLAAIAGLALINGIDVFIAWQERDKETRPALVPDTASVR